MNATRAKLVALMTGLCAGPLVVVTTSGGSTTLILMALGGMALALAIATHPTLGLFATALMIPLERFGRITTDSSSFTISVMRIVGILAVSGWLLHVMLKKKPIRLGWAFWLYMGYVGLAHASFFYSTDPEGSSRSSGQLISNVLFFVVVIGTSYSFRIVKLGTVLWLLATVLIGLYAIYDWHFPKGFIDIEDAGMVLSERFLTVSIDNSEWESGMVGIRRSVGSSSHFAPYGINLIVALPFFFFFLRQRPRWYVAAILWISLFVISYNILLTNTRAVLICFILATLMCIGKKLMEIRPSVLIATLLCVVAAIPFVRPEIYERLFDPVRYTSSGSGSLRIRMSYWKVGMEIIQENWLLGTGIGNEAEIPRRSQERFLPKRTSVHNVYLNTLIEVGVVGAAVFFAFIAFLLYQCIQAAVLLRERKFEEAYWYMVACQIAMLSVMLFGVQCEVYSFPLKGWWYVAGVTVVMHRIAVELSRRPALESGISSEELLVVA